MKRVLILVLAGLPLFAGCSILHSNPVPPAPKLVGVQAQDAAWAGEIKRSPDSGEPTFVPLTQARHAVADAKAQPHVGDYDARSLQQAEAALTDAQDRWDALADKQAPASTDLAAVARDAHRAQRLAEIARFTAVREISLDQLDGALRHRRSQAAGSIAGDRGLAGQKVIPERFGDVAFEPGTARLTDGSRAVVQKLAGLMQRQSGYGVAIYGYTDNSPPAATTLKAFVKANPGLDKQAPEHADKVEAFNLALSAARARAVAQQLVNDGVAADRIGARGFGDRRPVASNDTPEGRRANRRVDAVIVPMPKGQSPGDAASSGS